MRTRKGMFIVISIMILLDFYVFNALQFISHGAGGDLKALIYTAYWVAAFLVLSGLTIIALTEPDFFSRKIRTYFFATVLAFIFAQIFSSVFFLVDDVRRLIQWIIEKVFSNKTEISQVATNYINRSAILSWIGFGAGTTLFASLVYGFSNKYNYKVKHVRLAFDNLPPAFNGLKIVHFSDVHSGSFMNKKAVEHGVDKIMEQNADLIIFSGDLVNDRATEMEDYMDVFKKVKAPMGVYSILGNHDYGDYVRWPYHGVTKEQNLKDLIEVQKKLGWKLLMNEHAVFEKQGQKIVLMGIENWSAKARFPKHGDLKKAYAGTENYPFKILISHDPSHWEAQVTPDYKDIDVTLSGHTHGMQFGIDIAGFKWSPVQYFYKEWDGLYEEGQQKLYVNPGFGFIGYPGRVGILPEITVLELISG